MSGDAAGAYSKYANAAAQEPPHGIYKLYSNMSLAALTMGDAAAAMEAALLAVDNAPDDWTTVRSAIVLPICPCNPACLPGMQLAEATDGLRAPMCLILSESFLASTPWCDLA